MFGRFSDISGAVGIGCLGGRVLGQPHRSVEQALSFGIQSDLAALLDPPSQIPDQQAKDGTAAAN